MEVLQGKKEEDLACTVVVAEDMSDREIAVVTVVVPDTGDWLLGPGKPAAIVGTECGDKSDSAVATEALGNSGTFADAESVEVEVVVPWDVVGSCSAPGCNSWRD